MREALASCTTMNEAAQSLGMHPTTLWRKLVQHNMGQEGNDSADRRQQDSVRTDSRTEVRTDAKRTHKGREAWGK